MKRLLTKATEVIVFLTLIIMFVYFGSYDAYAEVKMDGATDLNDYWTSNVITITNADNKAEKKVFTLTSDRYSLKDIYGLKVIFRGKGIINGPLAIEADNTSDVNEVWGNDYEWNEAISIKLTEYDKNGLCSFTYETGKSLFTSETTWANIYIGQYWPGLEEGDIAIYDLILLDKKGKVIDQIHKTSLTSEETLYVGESVTLKVANPAGSIVWNSSNSKIASVDKTGKVTPKKKGNCVISAKIGKETYKCKITVNNAALNYSSVSLPIGEAFSLIVNGTTAKSWSSDSSKIVTVSRTGVLTAKKQGTATIKAKCANGKTYKCKITVFDQNALLSPDYRTITSDMKSNVEKVLKSQLVTFTMNWFGNTNRLWDMDYFLDANMFDLMEDKVLVNVDYTVLKKGCEPRLTLNGAQVIDTWWSDGNDGLTKGFKRTTAIDTSIGKHNMIMELSKTDVETIKAAGSVFISLPTSKVIINKVSITGQPVKTFDAIYANATSPVTLHGSLRVEGTQVVDEHGEPYRLLGVSFAWNQLALEYTNSKSVYDLNRLWGANCVRVAEHAETELGYASKEGNKAEILHFVENMIDACIEAGVYAIVDWHCFYNPLTYSDDAVEYFDIISKKYAGCPNIIYEICNEPCPDDSTPEEDDSWDIIKQYADKVIPVIRKNSPDAMIIVGGPDWSNDVLVRANDPLDYDNIIYTKHIYASTNKDYEDVEKAINMGLPILITEMSPDGMNGTDYAACDKWFDLLDKYNVGYFYWSFWAVDAAALKKGTVKRNDWKEADYSEVGSYMYHSMRNRTGLE